LCRSPFQKDGEWTSAVNVNFGAALEYALNQGRSRLSGKLMGLPEKPIEEFAHFEEVKEAFFRQLSNLIEHAVIGTVVAQKIHMEMVPRPFLSACVDGCLKKGADLSKGGANYNMGPVLTGIGLGVVANSLAAIKKLVFEDKITSLGELNLALDKNWEGFDELRKQALGVPKYGNDDDYVDSLAREISDFYFRETRNTKTSLVRPSILPLWAYQTTFPQEKLWGPFHAAEGQGSLFRKGSLLLREAMCPRPLQLCALLQK